MSNLTYYLLDVFTSERFKGNPLAVFLDCPAISAGLMANIANELNLSETVFVSKVEDGDGYQLRIFTPRTELPFAGHPTIGAACALRQISGLGPELKFRLAAGEFRVCVNEDRASFIAPRPAVSIGLDRTNRDAAALLGVDESAVVQVTGADAGVPFALIELSTRDTLRRCAVSLSHWRDEWATGRAPHIYAFCRSASNGQINARMFAPAMGIEEDPATGGAAAALAALLPDGDFEIIQGEDMGRRSVIRLSVKSARASIGGSAVIIGKGELYLPSCGAC